MVLFIDDTSVIATGMNNRDSGSSLNQMLKTLSHCLMLICNLNFNKFQYVEVHYMNYYSITSKIVYDQKNSPNVTETKFLGPIIDHTLTWKEHIDHVINTIFRSYCALRNIKHFVASDILRLIYFAHIHCILSCGIIWGGGGWLAMPLNCKRELLE
jgi:hypothetical protein